jgi:hypothetical protein
MKGRGVLANLAVAERQELKRLLNAVDAASDVNTRPHHQLPHRPVWTSTANVVNTLTEAATPRPDHCRPAETKGWRCRLNPHGRRKGPSAPRTALTRLIPRTG